MSYPVETDEFGRAIPPKIHKAFIGLFYDQGGNIWVETCYAKDDNEAYEQLERIDSNLMLFTIEEAKAVRNLLDEIIKECEE